MNLQLPSPLQPLPTPPWLQDGTLSIKRDDLIHPIISGNKARKLQGLMRQLRQNQNRRPAHILSMGGNRSNFLHALAYLCQQEGIALSAFIRGAAPPSYGRTLQDLHDWGTSLHFVDKEEFKRLREQPDYARQQAQAMHAKWLPEGGSNADALHGIAEAIDELEHAPDNLFVPVGTGCTALGLAHGLRQRNWHTRVIGVVVLKGVAGEHGIIRDMQRLAQRAQIPYPAQLHLEHRFCGKGFGRQSAALREQQAEFERDWQIPLDPVYSVKLCQAFKHYASSRHPLTHGQNLLWHTGGLQGNRA